MIHNWRMGHKSLLSAIAIIHYTPVVGCLITFHVKKRIFYFQTGYNYIVGQIFPCRPIFFYPSLLIQAKKAPFNLNEVFCVVCEYERLPLPNCMQDGKNQRQNNGLILSYM